MPLESGYAHRGPINRILRELATTTALRLLTRDQPEGVKLRGRYLARSNPEAVAAAGSLTPRTLERNRTISAAPLQGDAIWRSGGGARNLETTLFNEKIVE